MLLSIIIPVFNGATTINRCLNSIYSQGLAESDFEVICVDDCSSDPLSVAAIDSYKYLLDCTPRNLILIKHQVNKRQGAARNTGLRAAKGEWIHFVDCDDYYIENSLGRMFEFSSEHKELVIFLSLLN